MLSCTLSSLARGADCSNTASSEAGSIDARFSVIFDHDTEMTLSQMQLNVSGDQNPKHILSLGFEYVGSCEAKIVGNVRPITAVT